MLEVDLSRNELLQLTGLSLAGLSSLQILNLETNRLEAGLPKLILIIL